MLRYNLIILLDFIFTYSLLHMLLFYLRTVLLLSQIFFSIDIIFVLLHFIYMYGKMQREYFSLTLNMKMILLVFICK